MIWNTIKELLPYHAGEIWLILWLILWTWWDLRYRVICRWQGYLVAFSGVVWQGLTGQLFTASVIGGLALGTAVFGFSLLTRDRFGRGDAMVVWCLGLYLGFGQCLSVLMWGLLVASVVSLYLLWICKSSKDQSIPFIPCLAAGYLLHVGLPWILG